LKKTGDDVVEEKVEKVPTETPEKKKKKKKRSDKASKEKTPEKSEQKPAEEESSHEPLEAISTTRIELKHEQPISVSPPPHENEISEHSQSLGFNNWIPAGSRILSHNNNESGMSPFNMEREKEQNTTNEQIHTETSNSNFSFLKKILNGNSENPFFFETNSQSSFLGQSNFNENEGHQRSQYSMGQENTLGFNSNFMSDRSNSNVKVESTNIQNQTPHNTNTSNFNQMQGQPQQVNQQFNHPATHQIHQPPVQSSNNQQYSNQSQQPVNQRQFTQAPHPVQMNQTHNMQPVADNTQYMYQNQASIESFLEHYTSILLDVCKGDDEIRQYFLETKNLMKTDEHYLLVMHGFRLGLLSGSRMQQNNK